MTPLQSTSSATQYQPIAQTSWGEAKTSSQSIPINGTLSKPYFPRLCNNVEDSKEEQIRLAEKLLSLTVKQVPYPGRKGRFVYISQHCSKNVNSFRRNTRIE